MNVTVDDESLETIHYNNVQNNKDTFRQFANAYYVGKVGAWNISFNNDLFLNRGKRLWSPRLSMTLTGQDFKMQYCGRALRHTNPIFNTKFYNSFSLPADFVLTADVLGHTSGDRAIIHEKPSYQLNMGLSKKLRQWTLQLQATDMFHTARNSMDFYGDSSVDRIWKYSDARGVKLTVRYRFNSTTSKYKGQGAGFSEKSRLY